MAPFDVPAACPGWLIAVFLFGPPLVALWLYHRDDIDSAIARRRRLRAERRAHESFTAHRAALRAATFGDTGASPPLERSGVADPSPQPRTQKRAAA